MSATFLFAAVLLGIGAFYYPELRKMVQPDYVNSPLSTSSSSSRTFGKGKGKWSSPGESPPVTSEHSIPSASIDPPQPEVALPPAVEEAVEPTPPKEAKHVVSTLHGGTI